MSVPGLILSIARFIDEHKWCCSYTDLAKKISASDAKYWLKINNSQLKYWARLTGIFQKALKPKLPYRQRYRNACSSQKSSDKIETVCFLCPGAIIILS